MTHDETLQGAINSLLGLSNGQQRSLFISGTKGSGWYNEKGQWIGWGDLSNEDMVAVARTLGVGARFIVLHAEDAYWRFQKVIVRDPSRAYRDEDAPGLDYIAEHAILIVETNAIYTVNQVLPPRNTDVRDGITYQVLDKKAAIEKILSGMAH